MENPYQSTAAHQIRKPRISRSAEAQEYPALRRVRLFFLLIGILNLIGPAAHYLVPEAERHSKIERTHFRNLSRGERAVLKDNPAYQNIRSTQNIANAVDFVIFTTLIACAFGLFFNPALCCLVGLVIYSGITGCIVYYLVVAQDTALLAFSSLGILVRLLVSCLLLWATIIAFRFQRDYQHRMNLGIA